MASAGGRKKAAKKKATKKAAKKPAARTNRAVNKGGAKKAPRKPRERRPKWVAKFIEALRENGTVTHAAAEAGIGRRTAYDLLAHSRETEGKFAEEWADAEEAATEDLEASTFKKAKDGWLEPVYYKGERVGVKNKFAPSLAMWMLARRKPEVYNLPTYDPLQAASNAAAADGGVPTIQFFPDPDAAREAAEKEGEEAGS